MWNKFAYKVYSNSILNFVVLDFFSVTDTNISYEIYFARLFS